MVRSIRWRLQVWYGLVLLAVVAGFAGILYYRAWSTKNREIDGRLEAVALYLTGALRSFPLHELDDTLLPPPPPPPPAPGDERGPPRPPRLDLPPPPRRSAERLLADLTLPPETRSPPGEADHEKPYFGVWRASGSLLKAIGQADRPVHFGPEPFRSAPPPGFRETWLVGPGGTHILVGKSIVREVTELRAFAWQLAVLAPALLGIGLAGGWVVSSRVVKPIARMSATASTISATNLGERLDTRKVDVELANLAHVLNAMLDRLQAAFERQTQFTADASHELRTPLAVIRSHAELALSKTRSPEEYRDTIQACLRATGRMTALVERLLILARADAGWPGIDLQSVDLTKIVTDTVDQFRSWAADKDLTLSVNAMPASIHGDPTGLIQIVSNLLSNAVQYNRPGGEISVHLESDRQEVLLRVSDTGLGIPEADRPHIFERFYRVDKARSRASGGTGLGLAICKSIVELHGGTIECSSTDSGSTFTVRLTA
jgi:heavy metal sensor kinase